MLPHDSYETYRFLDFELDVPAYELRRNGRPVRLEPRPMDLLILLVERRGQFVSHEEIVARLWGNDVFVEIEAGIHTAIRKIRRGLRDSADDAKFVETIPGRGYRFIAPVEVLPPAPAISTPAHSRQSRGPKALEPAFAGTATTVLPPRWSRRHWMAAAAVVTGAIVWLAMASGTGRNSEPASIRLVRATSFPGSEGGPPALSPDGNFVAFNWTGPDFAADGDLWVKAVDGDALIRLTDTPRANEVNPVWSPDGRQIAFVRIEGTENRGIHLMSSLGGSEQKVTDGGASPSWLPDSRSLVFSDRAGPGSHWFTTIWRLAHDGS